MRSISLQLHATPSDIVRLVKEVPEATRGQLLGYARNRVQTHLPWNDSLEEEALKFQHLIVLPKAAEGCVGDELGDLNERCAPLVFGMPHVQPGRINDVMIGSRDVSGQFSEQITAWRKYLNACRKPLIKGATVTQPGQGSAFYPRMYATAAAVALSRQGTALILGNSLVVSFDER